MTIRTMHGLMVEFQVEVGWDSAETMDISFTRIQYDTMTKGRKDGNQRGDPNKKQINSRYRKAFIKILLSCVKKA